MSSSPSIPITNNSPSHLLSPHKKGSKGETILRKRVHGRQWITLLLHRPIDDDLDDEVVHIFGFRLLYDTDRDVQRPWHIFHNSCH